MEDFNKLASYLANLNYSSVRYIELVCSLPDFGKEVSYLPDTPPGEMIELDLVEVKDLLKSLTKSAAKYDVGFTFDRWTQKPNCLRMLVDVQGPEHHPTPYVHVQLNFVQDAYNVEVTNVEYEDYSTGDAVWPLTRPELIKDCIKVLNFASLYEKAEWRINLPDVDKTVMRELKSVLEGFGYACVEGVTVDMRRKFNIDTNASIVAKRKDTELSIIVDKKIDRGYQYVLSVK